MALESGASFSEDRRYRYSLWRDIPGGRPLDGGSPANERSVLFICLNPSTADEVQNDSTVTRLIGFARRWGYGRVYVANIFAWRSADPKELYICDDPVGTDNDAAIAQMAKKCHLIVCAWGNHGKFLDRGDQVLRMFWARDLAYFALNQTGQPKHPLYVAADSKLQFGSLQRCPVAAPEPQEEMKL